jgi:hypothetical protein
VADEVIPLFEDAATTEYASSAYIQTVLIYIATTPKYPTITGNLWLLCGSLCGSLYGSSVAHTLDAL